MSMLEKKQPLSDREREVIAYLRHNPDFFSRHPEVLESLYLPHNSGSAVSLIEKQTAVLRERNTELRTRLRNLMEQSKANDELFGRSRELVLKLIDADSGRAIADTLLTGFRDTFGVEFASLTLLDADIGSPRVNLIARSLAQEKLGGILETDEAICGVLRSQQLIALFGGDTARQVGSAITLRLTAGGEVYGVLALGNRDSHHYHGGMDTLFLTFIVDILNRVLPPHL